MAAKNDPNDYTGREFVLTRTFDAPRSLVFKAWTDPKQVEKWWGPHGFTNPVCQWDPRPGKAIHVVMRGPNGMEHPMGGEFREIVEPERLVFTSGALDEKGNLLFEFQHTVTFAEHNGKTRLTMLARVIRTTAEANKYIGGFEVGMTQSLERLEQLLAAKPEPFVIERVFDAPVARVWKAITDKDAMKRWYFDLAAFKPEVGFKFQFDVSHQGFNYSHRCVVKEVVPEKKLAYTWRYEGFEGDSLVTFELFAEGDKTRLRLTHTGLETFPKIAAFARENFAQGWTSLIGAALKNHVEGK